MNEFGWEIIQALVTEVQPDPKVRLAMNEINASKRLRIAAAEKAEAQKLLTVKRAEADAQSKYLQGEGIARQRKAIVDGLRDSVHDFSTGVKGLDAKQILDVVLVTQYFDTLKDLGTQSKDQTIFVPHNPGNLATLADDIRNGVLQNKVKNNIKIQNIA
eukprot:Platyproteum_vivax@DN5428_c0_g1_i2.p1